MIPGFRRRRKGWFTATESRHLMVITPSSCARSSYRGLSLRASTRRASIPAPRRRRALLRRHGERVRLAAAYTRPGDLAAVSDWDMGLYTTGFFIAFVFLVVGCFLDAIPAIIIVGTILQPLAEAVHMHPVHFAMIGIVSLAFGLVTPPYGLCLMISCSVAGIRMVDALKDTMIMLLPMLGVLTLVILWPEVVLFRPPGSPRWFLK
jgi:hypothetical protein